MKCQRCGHEIGDSLSCSYCGYTGEEVVREMSSAEQSGYQGVTLDEQGNTEEAGGQRQDPWTGGQRIYMRGIRLGHSPSWMEKLLQHYWLSRLLIGLVIAAIVTILVFVAMPIILLIAGIGIVVWILLSFFQR